MNNSRPYLSGVVRAVSLVVSRTVLYSSLMCDALMHSLYVLLHCVNRKRTKKQLTVRRISRYRLAFDREHVSWFWEEKIDAKRYKNTLPNVILPFAGECRH